MRKLIFALLVISSLCNQVTFKKFNHRVLVSDNYIGYIEASKSEKSFFQYFYSPEDIMLNINGSLENNPIVKLEKNKHYSLTAEVPKVPETLPYNGRGVVPKEVPFYFLELYQENKLAIIKLSSYTRTVHFPTHRPMTFRIIVENIYEGDGEYKLTLRGDDISLVKNVNLITVVDDGTENVLKLKADKDKVFTSPILISVPKETYMLEINLIKGDITWRDYLNYLQADLHLIKSDTRATLIENKPQYLSVEQVFRKKTQITSYDDFLIEFPQDLVTLTKTTLSEKAPKDLISVVVSQGRIHVTNKSRNPNNSNTGYPEVYEIEAEFVVKSLPKVSEPIIIARYNIEDLKSTDGFILRGSYHDDKVYFKASSKVILENNVYFSFKEIKNLTPNSHQISIGYDALPSSVFVDFSESSHKTQIVELKVDRKTAEQSEIIIIALKRSRDSKLKSTLSYFEVKVTHDIYQTINRSGVINYSLKKGQSIFINNYAFNYVVFGYYSVDDSQEISINNINGQVVSYARKMPERILKSKFSNLSGLFSFENGDEIHNYKYFKITSEEFPRNSEEEMGSIIKITALTNEATGTITTGKDLKRKTDSTDIKSLVFLN